MSGHDWTPKFIRDRSYRECQGWSCKKCGAISLTSERPSPGVKVFSEDLLKQAGCDEIVVSLVHSS